MQGEIDRDAREDEEWFGRLPSPVQARLRAAWASERSALASGSPRTRLRTRRAARDSAIVMPALVLVANLFQLPSFLATLGLLVAATAAGAAVGAILGSGTHGRFRAGLLGTAAFLPLQLALSSLDGGLLALVCLFFGALLAINVYGVFGLCLEMRARPGSGAD